MEEAKKSSCKRHCSCDFVVRRQSLAVKLLSCRGVATRVFDLGGHECFETALFKLRMES